jgi:hypothetical protein
MMRKRPMITAITKTTVTRDQIIQQARVLLDRAEDLERAGSLAEASLLDVVAKSLMDKHGIVQADVDDGPEEDEEDENDYELPVPMEIVVECCAKQAKPAKKRGKK